MRHPSGGRPRAQSGTLVRQGASQYPQPPDTTRIKRPHVAASLITSGDRSVPPPASAGWRRSRIHAQASNRLLYLKRLPAEHARRAHILMKPAQGGRYLPCLPFLVFHCYPQVMYGHIRGDRAPITGLCTRGLGQRVTPPLMVADHPAHGSSNRQAGYWVTCLSMGDHSLTSTARPTHNT